MGKVIYPRKGEVHTAPVTIPAVFADATWEQIIEACETNTVPATWEVGDQKSMTIDGTDYPIDIIGKNHDEYSDGSGYAPLTFQMNVCYSSGDMYSERVAGETESTNRVGWTDCFIRKTDLPGILAKMPSEVQAAIKEVNKLTFAGNSSATVVTTADKLFLLSSPEIFGSTGTYEGVQYEVYALGNTTIKTYKGNAYNWWTRSPTGTQNYHIVTNAGKTGSSTSMSTRGIVPAFCF